MNEVFEYQKTLFENIKLHKYDSVIEIINKYGDQLDFNIRDNSNTYIIQYAIMYNNLDIVKLIIKYSCKLDFIDSDGHNILYIPIKFSYNKIIKLLLENNNIIGIPLIDIEDKLGSYPIHYAVVYNNIEAFELILKYSTNINKIDIKGNTCLHLAIKQKNYDIMKKILVHPNINPNIQTNIGECPLHIAANYEDKQAIQLLLSRKDILIDLIDYEYQITSLMYIVSLNNIELSQLLLDRGANTELQDSIGNSSLHMAIIEQNINLANILMSRHNNFNITNIDGMTAFHLLLSLNKHDPNISNRINIETLNKYNIEQLIIHTNLNIQDNEGNTIWHMMGHNELWYNYIKLLKTKKNNVFIKNNKNITPYDIIKKHNKYIDEFMDLLTHSYYNILLIGKNEYTTEWENLCANKKKPEKYCLNIIHNNIIKNYKSVPSKRTTYCDIEIEQYDENILFSTFTGVAIDVIVGIKMLYNISNNIITSLDNNNIIINKELDIYYKQVGIKKNKIDFLNFEIVWLYQKLYMIDDIEKIIKKYQKLNKRFLIIPIGIELSNGTHSNILIYDRITNTMERFEPNGADVPPNYNYNEHLFDKMLYNYFKHFFQNMIYLKPNNFLPKIGFQSYEQVEYYKNRKLGDPGGFCAAWCIWYAMQRIKYSELLPDKLVRKLMKKIKYNNFSFKNLIRHFATQITKERDLLLNKVNLDINKYINYIYDDKTIYDLEKKIIN